MILPAAFTKIFKMRRVLVGLFLTIVLVTLSLLGDHTSRDSMEDFSKSTPNECHFRPSVTGNNHDVIMDDGILPPSALNNLTVDDIAFTIKTSSGLADRLDAILLTWFPQAKRSVTFVTDTASLALMVRTEGRLVATTCATDHSLGGLNCKMAAEFEQFMKHAAAKWWCHMDDDNYVNTDVLVRLLSKYDPEADVYIGRPSLDYPQPYTWEGRPIAAWFAHGGCGFCVSRGLAMKMDQHMSGGGLVDIAHKLPANDDCAVGFIINYLLHVKLTASNLFNSHYHYCELGNLTVQEITHQATLSYSGKDTHVHITPGHVQPSTNFFREQIDPSRFFTVHCLLHPDTNYCSKDFSW